MAFPSGVSTLLTDAHCKLPPNTEGMLPIQWVFLDFKKMISGSYKGLTMGPSVVGARQDAVLFRCVFMLRFYALPLYLYPSWWTALSIFATMATAGFYLGVFFAISHNFEGVEVVTLEQSKQSSWLRRQAKTSSTVCGQMLGFLNGGTVLSRALSRALSLPPPPIWVC